MNICEYPTQEERPKIRDTSKHGYLKEIAINTGSTKEEIQDFSNYELLKIIAENTAKF